MKRPFFLIYRAAHPFVSWLRSRGIVVKLLFGINIKSNERIHYDTTTILFRKTLAKEVQSNNAVLEMGIGQAALLSLSLAKKRNMKIHGVDLAENRVKSSILTAKLNDIEAKFWQSDLFSSVDGVYDVIFFNPPYVDKASGQRLDLSRRLNLDNDAAWNGGGSDGTDVLREFVRRSKEHLKKDGKLLIGVQDFYVGTSLIKEIAAAEDFYVRDTITGFFNPSRIYVLKKHSNSLV